MKALNDNIWKKDINCIINKQEYFLPVNANMNEASYKYSYEMLEGQVKSYRYTSIDSLNEAAFYILWDLGLYFNDKVLRLTVMEWLSHLLINIDERPNQITKDFLVSLYTIKHIANILLLARYRGYKGLTDTSDKAFKLPYIQYENKVATLSVGSITSIEERIKVVNDMDLNTI